MQKKDLQPLPSSKYPKPSDHPSLGGKRALSEATSTAYKAIKQEILQPKTDQNIAEELRVARKLEKMAEEQAKAPNTNAGR